MTGAMATDADQQRVIEALRSELDARTAELAETRAERAATAEILEVINSSPTNLTPVFEAILRNAHALCGVAHGTLQLFDGETVRAVAVHGIAESLANILRQPRPVSEAPTLQVLLQGRRYSQVNDVRESDSPILQRTAQLQGARTLLSVPLRREAKLLGMIVCARREVKPFTEREISIVESFAAQAGIAIENARLLSELRQRTADLSESLQQQTATADVLKLISRSAFDLQTVLDTLTESATQLCNADMGSIARKDEGGYYHATNYKFAIDWVKVADSYRLQPGKGSVVGRALLAKKAVQIIDVLEDADYGYPDIQKAAGYRTLLGVPLMRQGEAIGVLFLGRKTVEQFTDKQIELVSTFADQAVIAIENVRLFDEVQARTRDLSESLQQQTATADVLKVISRSAFDLQTVLDTLVESATHLCEADHGWLFQRNGDLLYFSSSFGHGTAQHQRIREFFQSRDVHIDRGSIVGRSATEGRVVHVPDVLADAEYQWGEAQKIGGYRAALGAPLLRDGNVVGVIFVARTRPEPFSPKHIELVTTFADQAVIAIENVRLFDEVQLKTRDLTEALTYQTGSANILSVIASSPTDVQPVLTAIVESACELCDAYDAAVVLRDGEDLRFSAHRGPIPIGLGRWPINRRWTAGRAFLDRKPVHIEDLRDEKHADFSDGRELSLRMGHRSILSVPLLREGESIGAIVLRRIEVHPFSDKQIALLQTFADQAVIAIGNVRLFDEVQARTRELQESLQQQTATADVLKVISRSTFDLQTVLDTLLTSAARLCQADHSFIFLREGEVYRYAAGSGGVPAWIEYLKEQSLLPGRGTVGARAVLEARTIHIPDVLEDPEYTFLEAQKRGGFRTALGVPLLREGTSIGVMVLTRPVVRPFEDTHIALVTTFADQAVIAIENIRLFENVQARTRELSKSLDDLRAAQDRLIQTEKLASLGQLTAGIAHEIKNPLNFVNNFAALSVELTGELNDALKQTSIADKIRTEVDELTGLLKDNLTKVVQHGKRADSIVRNMLLHSRAGSGEHRPTDINALLDESLNLAYHGARAEKPQFNVTLRRDFDPGAGMIEAFPQEITRVFLNLLSNGFYAVTKRKAEIGDSFDPVVTATTKGRTDDVEIRIRDNGTGIPSDVKEKMFNPFFTTKPAGEGTGLGLSMSHDIIVKQHGGTIDVATTPGEFTEFKIVLPRNNNLSNNSRG